MESEKTATPSVEEKSTKSLKGKYAVLIILGILLADQVLKIYIKTHFRYDEDYRILGRWFRLHFIENEGMAWGWKLKLGIGKLLLTLFRTFAVIWGTFYIAKIIRKKYNRGFVLCVCLIYAGALGNLIDSAFYGVIFDKGVLFNALSTDYAGYQGVASLSTHGYGAFLHGNVVDMVYCPLVRGHFPSWLPFIGGQRFEFFNMIFNLADAAISVGVITLLVFQKRLFRMHIKGDGLNNESVQPIPVSSK